MSQRELILKEALLLASLGIRVIPVHIPVKGGGCTCRKGKECASPGKHPCLQAWQQHATTDEKKIREWFENNGKYPFFLPNLGMQLGPKSGVIDMEWDTREGNELLREAWGGALPMTPSFRSGRQGYGGHMMLRYREDLATGLANVALPGADLKLGHGQLGSQSVVPPSIHKSGRRYQWVKGRRPDEIEIAEIPDEVVEQLQKYRKKEPESTSTSVSVNHDMGWLDAIAGLEEGTRNHGMAQLIGRSLANAPDIDGAGQFKTFLDIININQRHDPPLDLSELSDVWFSILGRERAKRAEQGTELKREFEQLADISDVEDIDWIWEGWLPRKGSLLLVGDPFAGKTTLISSLLRVLEKGGDFCGTAVEPAKVLVVTEEAKGLWRSRHLDAPIGEGKHVWVESRPFKAQPSMDEWKRYCELLVKDYEDGLYEVVIIDPWANLNPCEDENLAAQTKTALLPLYGLTQAGMAVLLMHHASAAAKSLGKSARGSTALPGWADIQMELLRYDQNNSADRKRVLRPTSRYKDTPHENLIVEWQDDGTYLLKGGTTPHGARKESILECLGSGKWMTSEEIRDVALKIKKADIAVSPKMQFARDMQRLKGEGRVEFSGQTRGRKYRRTGAEAFNDDVTKEDLLS